MESGTSLTRALVAAMDDRLVVFVRIAWTYFYSALSELCSHTICTHSVLNELLSFSRYPSLSRAITHVCTCTQHLSMGDKASLAKARQELEDLYLGIPDESVDLTFKDMPSFQENDSEERNPSFKNKASFQQNDASERRMTNMSPIHEERLEDKKAWIHDLSKSSSLDFSKALQAAKPLERHAKEDELNRERLARNNVKRGNGDGLIPLSVESSQVYDDASVFSTLSPFDDKGGRKRPGIPHLNICTLCSEYTYFFRHRCLVCGRVYCKSCVGIGMGEMSEGRKCVYCLGRRLSQRYIQRAGHSGCCCWIYPNAVKQQELIWAEKGPRRSRECGYGRSGIEPMSRSPVMMGGTPTRSDVIPGTPSRFPAMINSGPSSFISNSTFSPNPHNFPL